MSHTNDGKPDTTAVYPKEGAARPPYPPDDPRLTRALEEYLAAQESGHPPGRQEFLARHADIADELAACLDGLEFVHAAAPRLQPPVPAVPASAAELHPGTALGDFRILREVGRGGMGIVYEAEQVSLGRRVALKVLPFAAALDGRRLQRFKNEAQAAAQLHHTHIVPVFGVGDAQGVHYYAMQYIEGQTLAAIIRELRQLSGLDGAERAGADGLSSQLAGELASGRWVRPGPGLAARPVSPGLGARDTTLVAGAASTERPTTSPAFLRTVAQLGVQAAEALEHAHQLGVVHRDVKPANLLVDARGSLWIADFGLALFHGDPSLTQTGDVIGTLRYMSPEQALARRGLVDHRTDIYSLGVTLYELLTLEPAFAGDDRQEVLRQVTLEEPRPPRRLNRAIPPDLETIILKATAKEVEGRYATAQELADDLRRFLGNEPVRARRATLWQRLAKWSRRHPAVVWSAVLLLVMAVLSLTACTLLVWRAQQEAETQRLRAEDNAALAVEQSRLAEAKTQLAQQKTRLARRAVDEMYGEVHGWLFHTPNTEPQQIKFLSKAMEYYQEFAHEDTTDPLVRWKMGEAEWNVAEIHRRLGHVQEAEEAYRQADTLLTELVAGSPANPDYRLALSNSTLSHAELLAATGHRRQGEQACLRALTCLQKLPAHVPRGWYYRHQLGLCHYFLGRLWRSDRRFREADAAFRRAVDLFEKLAVEFPNYPDIGASLAKAENDRANLLQYLVLDPTGATADMPARGARVVALAMAPQAPSILAVITALTARAAEKQVTLQEAANAYGRAIGIFQKLVPQFPAFPDYQWELAIAWHNLGWLLHQIGQTGQAEVAYREALPRLERLVDSFAGVPTYQRTFGGLLHHMAMLRWRNHDLGQARLLLEQAVRHQEMALRANPDDPDWRDDSFKQYSLLGDVLAALGEHAPASRIAEELARSFPNIWQAPFAARQLLVRCVGLAERDTRLDAARRVAQARTYGDAAHKLLDKAMQQLGQDPERQNTIAWFLVIDQDARFRDAPQALKLAEQAIARKPEMANYWRTLGVAHYRLRHWRPAAVALEKGVKLRPDADSTEAFFLAMAQWQLGHKEQAAQCYDRAVRGMSHGMSGQEETGWLRDEAAALLGLSRPRSHKSK